MGNYNQVSKAKYAFNNILWGIISRVISIVGPFIIRTLLIKKMGGEYAGLNSLFSSILDVLSIAELGVSSAIVFNMYEPLAKKDNQKLSAVYAFYRKAYTAIGLVILFAGVSIMPFLDKFISGSYPSNINIYFLYFIYLTNTVISYLAFGYKESLLVADQRSDTISTVLIISNFVMYLGQAIIICRIKNYYMYALMIPVSTLIANLAKSYIVDKRYSEVVCKGKLEKEEKTFLFKRIAGAFFSKVTHLFRNSYNSILISMFLGLLILTKYQNYFMIMSAIAKLLGIIAESLTASIGSNISTKNINDNYHDFNVFYLMYNWISGWCFTCLLCLYQPFMDFIYGKDYLLSLSCVILFCFYFYFLCIGNVAAVYKSAAGLWWEDKTRAIVESIVSLLLVYILGKHYGIYGILLASVVSVGLVNVPWASYVLFNTYFRRNVLEYWKKIIKDLMIISIISLITYFVCSLIHIDGIYCILIRGVICCIIPNVLLFLVYSRSDLFADAKRIVIKMIKY